MNHALPTPLPRFYSVALRAVVKIVPATEREEWMHVWQAEAWHMHDRRRHRRSVLIGSAIDLFFGMVSDALWLRADRISGSPALCLATLAALCLISLQFDTYFSGSLAEFLSVFAGLLHSAYLLGSVVAVVVTLIISSEARAQQADAGRNLRFFTRIRRACFYTAKLTLSLLFGLLLAAAFLVSFHVSHSWIVLQQGYLSAVFISATLRWAVWDQHQRCQHCLHALALPSRLGRPSHNLLDWNGTARTCRHGHGALHEPEMQTSWRASSHWVMP